MQNDTNDAETCDWSQIGSRTQYVAIWIFLVGRITITFASAYILFVVAYSRNRTEFLYRATPISFLLSGIFGTWVELIFLVKFH